MEPQLFDQAVDEQLARLAADAADAAAPSGSTDVTLYRRIEDVKRRQRSQAVQVRFRAHTQRRHAAAAARRLAPAAVDAASARFHAFRCLL
jgi:hypothetical protein